jgi:hypothetical protein
MRVCVSKYFLGGNRDSNSKSELVFCKLKNVMIIFSQELSFTGPKNESLLVFPKPSEEIFTNYTLPFCSSENMIITFFNLQNTNSDLEFESLLPPKKYLLTHTLITSFENSLIIFQFDKFYRINYIPLSILQS